MLALGDEATDDIPQATKGIVRATREQDATVLLRQCARSHRRVRVVDEAARAALDEPSAARKLIPAARARRPTVEHTHEEERCTIDRNRPKRNSEPTRRRRHGARAVARRVAGDALR